MLLKIYNKYKTNNNKTNIRFKEIFQKQTLKVIKVINLKKKYLKLEQITHIDSILMGVMQIDNMIQEITKANLIMNI